MTALFAKSSVNFHRTLSWKLLMRRNCYNTRVLRGFSAHPMKR